MRLDHVSYVASHDQISDVVQRIGSQIGTAFVDGGIHPQFGTRNFTAPLLNGQYIEVVCALDHPAAEKTPFGQAVTKKAAEGGGWLTWVYSVPRIEILEKLFKRSAVEAHRRRPDGAFRVELSTDPFRQGDIAPITEEFIPTSISEVLRQVIGEGRDRIVRQWRIDTLMANVAIGPATETDRIGAAWLKREGKSMLKGL